MKGIQRGTLVGGGVSFAAAGLQAGLESLSRSLDQMQVNSRPLLLLVFLALCWVEWCTKMLSSLVSHECDHHRFLLT